jgi:tripartite-type tricarboxylate transporter receptor subunit TctC
MRSNTGIRRRTAVAMGALALLTAGTVVAQDYPNKPIKLVISYPAGGPSDVVGRSLAHELSAQLGQQVFVENKGGASGLIALDGLTGSPADGYALMVLNNTTTTALHFLNKPLELDKRFTPVGLFLGVRMLLVVNPKVINARNVADLMAFAKGGTDVQYTSSGPGSPGHIMMEGFARQSGIKVTHVAYRGSAAALMDTVAGRVGLMVVEASSAVQHIQSGSLRAIATVSPGRASLLPDVPTSTEQNFPGLVMDSSFGLIAPPGTPAPVLERLRAALRKAIQADNFVAQAKTAGNAIEYVDGPAYRDSLIQDFDRWGRVIRDVGIKVN